MAPPSLKLLSFFLFISLLLSHQAQARSFFFSKVANTNNIPKTEEAPKKETTTTNVVKTKQEQEPTFIPQTETQNGYGLYGHDDSTTEATNDASYNENIPYTHYNPEKSGNFYNNNFETKSQNGDAKLTRQQGSYSSANNNPTSQNSKRLYNRDERQGMSDTRYVENGKYYYDLDSGNNNDNEQSQYRNSELVDSRKWYNNDNNNNKHGLYRNSEMVDSRNWYNNNNNDNNNNKGYYGSNNEKQSTYENNDVYQNEEFQESEDEPFVP